MKIYNEKETVYNVCRAYNNLTSNKQDVNFNSVFSAAKDIKAANVEYNTEVLNRAVVNFLHKIETTGGR